MTCQHATPDGFGGFHCGQGGKHAGKNVSTGVCRACLGLPPIRFPSANRADEPCRYREDTGQTKIVKCCGGKEKTVKVFRCLVTGLVAECDRCARPERKQKVADRVVKPENGEYNVGVSGISRMVPSNAENP